MSDRPDVLFLVLDSMRRDRVSAYEYERETTPTLDALANEATVFEHAYASAPWTLPSHCSLFTGLFPSEHGITNGFTDRSFRLPSEIPTLAEQLAEQGYHTAGFSNNPWVGQLSGLDRGFEEFVEWDLEISRSDHSIHSRHEQLYSGLHTVLGHASRQPLVVLKRRFFTKRLVERATQWIQHTADRDAPTFTFMNLMEAHSPYYPPQDAFRALGLKPPTALEARRLNVQLLAYIMGRSSFGKEKRARLMEYYDASVRYLDSMVDTLCSTLKRENLYDNLLLIICADHGKTLGEFDRDETPPHYVRDINTTVPLFIKTPEQTESMRVEQPFELHRLFEIALRGKRDLEQLLTDAPSTALVEDFVPHSGQQAETVTRWRVLSDGAEKYVTTADGQEYLFHGTGLDEMLVTSNPASTDLDRFRSILAERSERLTTERAASTDTDAPPEELNDSTEAQLKDLGYLD